MIRMLGIAGDKRQIGSRRLIRLRAALFPIPQRAERDVVAFRKLLLRQVQRPTDDLHAGSPLHAVESRLGQRLRVRIGARPFRLP